MYVLEHLLFLSYLFSSDYNNGILKCKNHRYYFLSIIILQIPKEFAVSCLSTATTCSAREFRKLYNIHF